MGLREVILADRPVSYWPLDSGVEAVASPGFFGTNHSGVFQYPGVIGGGRCLNLPASGDWYDSGLSGATLSATSFSVEIWVFSISLNSASVAPFFAKSDGTTGSEWLLHTENTSNTNNPGLIIYQAGSGSIYTDGFTTASMPLNTWCHLVATYDNATFPKIYMQGTVAPVGLTGGPTGSRAGNGAKNVTFGNYSSGSFPMGTGSLQHAAYYNYVLTPAQILRHYQAGLGNGYGEGAVLHRPGRRLARR